MKASRDLFSLAYVPDSWRRLRGQSQQKIRDVLESHARHVFFQKRPAPHVTVLQLSGQGICLIGKLRVTFDYDWSREKLIVREIRYSASPERAALEWRIGRR